MEVKPVQSANANSPMLVMELGIVILVKPVQYWNDLSPMEVTEFGIVTEVKHSQSMNILIIDIQLIMF
jgi:hypothetical protein